MDADLSPLEARGLWLGGSILLAGVAAWVAWLLRRLERPWAARWRTWSGRPWVYQILRLLFAVGIPAWVLLGQGQLTARGLGLQSPPWLNAALDSAGTLTAWEDWARDVGWGVLIGTLAAFVLFAGERQAAHIAAPPATPTEHDLGTALHEALYHEVHWAFYREPFILVLGIGRGAWAGLLLVALEAAINPARWADLRSSERGRDLLVRAFLAVVSALLFIQTQNLWVAFLVDTALGWSFGQSFRQVRRPAETAVRREEGAGLLAQS
ncbi:MAG: hypothetical protein ACLFU8_00795 [Anaerolineales bacterium]